MKRLALIAILVMRGILAAQEPTGIITGMILGLDGKPAAGIRVAAASPNASGQITAETLVAITQSDETGKYRIENVPPGRYGIVAGMVRSPTYYPGTANALEATLVTVGPGSVTASVDIGLVISPVSQQPYIAVRSPGQQAVGAGQLREEQRQQRLQSIAGRVIVEGVSTPSELSGLKLTFSGSGILPKAATVIFVDLERKTVTTEDSISTSIGRDGSIKVALEASEYTVSLTSWDTSSPSPYVLKSISLGSADLMKEKLKVSGPVTDEIVITLAPVVSR